MSWLRLGGDSRNIGTLVRTKTTWVIRTDDVAGMVETNWYHEHKGEVEVKTQIRV